MNRFYSVLLGAVGASPLLAASSSDTPTPSVLPENTYIIYCPMPDQLHKKPNSLIWQGPNNWKSYDTSFVEKIKKFTVAQWQGINVGQVTCVYEGLPKETFPVLLYSNLLSLTPTGGNWVAQKGQYSNCVSNDVKDCPIIIRKKSPPPNIYQELEELKNKAPNPNDFVGEDN